MCISSKNTVLALLWFTCVRLVRISETRKEPSCTHTENELVRVVEVVIAVSVLNNIISNYKLGFIENEHSLKDFTIILCFTAVKSINIILAHTLPDRSIYFIIRINRVPVLRE
jgi:hypothetical protein